MSVKKVYSDSFKIGVDIFLVLFFLFLVISISFNYFIGPTVINESINEEIQEKMMTVNNKKACKVVNSFANEEVYYISLCSSYYNVYNIKGEILFKKKIKAEIKEYKISEISSYLPEEVLENTKAESFTLGYYQNHLVFVINDDKAEYLVDYETKEIDRIYLKELQ